MNSVSGMLTNVGDWLTEIFGKKRSSGPLSVSFWHEFHKPPYGGGNQFMMALKKELEHLNVRCWTNSISPSIDVHICNSAWFDVERFEKTSKKRRIVMIHRIDGPIALYRGSDRAEDNKIFDLNKRFASATVCQSSWSYQQLLEYGYKPVAPEVIHNAVDNEIFHKQGHIPFSRDRKIKIISTAWSDNARKGGAFYKWLDDHLDWKRYEYTFVGRVQQSFSHIRHIPAQPSEKLAEMLRQHDVYITASQKDPCSNSLIEALACGLPALYLNDGGHGELTGHGGLPFSSEQEAIVNLDRIVDDYEKYQLAIAVSSMDSVAKRYMDLAIRTIRGHV